MAYFSGNLPSKKQQTEKNTKEIARENDILQAIMENTKAKLAYLDHDFYFVRVNLAYARNSGYKKEELIGRNHFELFPNKENQIIFEKVKKTGKGVIFFRKPFQFLNQPDRGLTYWDWTLVPIKNKNGRVLGMVLSLVDVTNDVNSDAERERLLTQIEMERKWAEQLAIEAEERASELDTVFSALSEALIIYNKNGMPVSANPATVKLFGFNPVGRSRESIINLSVFRHRKGDLVTMDEMPSTQALQGKITPSKYFLITDSTGKESMVLVSATPIKRREKVIGAATVMHDVSESWLVEKQKDDFVATASHELKTPVTTIKAFVQILQRRLQGDKNNETFRYLEKMDKQLDKLTALIGDLLDVNRFEAGKLDLRQEKFDFNQLVDEIIEDFQRSTESHQIIKLGKIKGNIYGDRDRLSQVLINLISNAIKYSPSAKKVVVLVKEYKGLLKVAVKDFGIGISLDDQLKLFKRFSRIDTGKGERFAGVGLGLYICSEIIKRHNGKIWAKSKEGKGTTFFFTLPLKRRRPKI